MGCVCILVLSFGTSIAPIKCAKRVTSGVDAALIAHAAHTVRISLIIEVVSNITILWSLKIKSDFAVASITYRKLIYNVAKK